MEKPVGQQTDLWGRAVIEMVPREKLVEDDLVDRGYDSDTDHRRGRHGTARAQTLGLEIAHHFPTVETAWLAVKSWSVSTCLSA